MTAAKDPELPLARRARDATGLTQPEFARTYGINVGTLRAWEQEQREPEGAHRIYLLLIERYPDVMKTMVKAVIG
jgi:putative transcriptional regulator